MSFRFESGTVVAINECSKQLGITRNAFVESAIRNAFVKLSKKE
jgi:hypothetical protein